MPSPVRQKRVAERLRAELSELLLQELKDPRLHLVTVTNVLIDRELEHANIFVAAMGEAERQTEVLQGLASAQGFIRRELARRLQLRRAPEVHFHWDATPDRVEHVGQLLDQLKAEEQPPDVSEEPGSSEQAEKDNDSTE
jgi:ribosome-binding factor A